MKRCSTLLRLSELQISLQWDIISQSPDQQKFESLITASMVGILAFILLFLEHIMCSLTWTCFITKISFKWHLVLTIKIMVLDPAENSFSEIMGLKTRLQWAEKDLWGKDLKTTIDNYFKLTFEVGQTGLQL